MQAIFISNPQDGSFTIYEHDLEAYLARTLVAELQAQGKVAYAVTQVGAHGGDASTCQRCKQSGADLRLEGGEPETARAETAQAGTAQAGTAQAPGRWGALGAISRRVKSPLDRPALNAPLARALKRSFPFLAASVLAVIGYILLSGPFSSYLISVPQVSFATKTFTPAPTATAAPATPTPPPTKTPAPTPTPRPTSTSKPTAVPTAAPTPTEESGCLEATAITSADAGQVTCVTGVVVRTHTSGSTFYIIFAERPDAFYMISYDRAWDAAGPGVCIQATGEIQMLGDVPVMIFGWSTDLMVCPPD